MLSNIIVQEDKTTDKKMEVILSLVADKFAACKDMEEVERAIKDVREMAKGKSSLNKRNQSLKFQFENHKTMSDYCSP